MGERSLRPGPLTNSITDSEAWRGSHQSGKDSAVRDLKLLVHVVQVDLDRPLRNRELPTDALVRQPLRHQASNLVLPSRQHPRKRIITLAALGCAPDCRGNKLLW